AGTGHELVIDCNAPAAGKWVGTRNQVQVREDFVVGLSGVPVHHAADLPVVEDALGQGGSGPSRFRNVIGEIDGEKVTSIEIAVPVIRPAVVAVIHNRAAIFTDVIQGVRPCVGDLRA